MSGYIGNPDAESEHALIFAENGVDAARSLLISGKVNTHCDDCGEPIAEGRRQFFIQRNQRCLYCVDCQPVLVAPRVRMLDRIL